jgi:hypothetical protein
MQASKLPKDCATSVRYNSEILEKLKGLKYNSIQDFLNKCIDEKISLKIDKAKK